MSRPSIGLVCQPGLEAVVERSTALDVIEIEPQVSWLPSRGAESVLDCGPVRVADAAGLPMLLHRAGLPVGGSAPIEIDQAQLVRELATHFECPWVSEHLSILRVPDAETGNVSTGVLLAPPPTAAAVEVAAANIHRLSALIDRPVIFETAVNYLRPRSGEMPDGEFFAAVAERADCGILLDLHNLWCNELNGRQTAQQVMERLPAARLLEIHVASGYWRDGHYLDAHSGLTERPVIEMLEHALERFPNVGAVVFEVSPDRRQRAGVTIDGVVAHLDELAAVVRRSSRRSGLSPFDERDPSFGTDRITSAILDFGNGRSAPFTVSTQLHGHQRAQIAGTTGRIEVDIPVNSQGSSDQADGRR